MKKLGILTLLSWFASCGGTNTFNVIVNVNGLGIVTSNLIVIGDTSYTIQVGTDEDDGQLTDATVKVEDGNTITLTADANSGSVFVGWDTDNEDFLCTTGLTCSFIVTKDTTISATFAP